VKLVPKRKRIVPPDNPVAMQDIITDISTNVTEINNTIEKAGKEAAVVWVIDGGGSAISTGVSGYLSVPFNCSIDAAEVIADQSGSIKIDIWMDSIGNYPPTDADTITGGNEPEISAGTTYYSSALSGWTRTLPKYCNLGFNVDSCTTITKATLTLYVSKAD
jgi:hypothetical protein